MGITDAEHNEYAEATGSTPTGTAIVSQLSCSIKDQVIEITIAPESRLAAMHKSTTEREHTTCNYGLEPAVQDIASQNGMMVSAVDDTGEVRAVECVDHPYFVGTLYQPQLRSSPETPHPVFVGLIEAAAAR